MPSDIVVPSHSDPVAREAARGIGGPVGQHARLGANGFWTPLRVLLALTLLTFVAGYLHKMPCRTHSWEHQYQYTRMCYTDVFALYFSEGLNAGKTPYAEHPVEYPVIIGGIMHVVASAVDDAKDFFDLTAVVLLVGTLVTTAAAVVAAGRRRPWDVALVALAPGLFLHGLTNWDMAAVAFATLFLAAWARRRPGLAGLWLGLGVATKLYPALFLGPLFLLCLRARRLKAFAITFGAAAVTWIAVNYPVWRKYPEAWGEFYRLNRERPADWDSLYFFYQEVMRRRNADGSYFIEVPTLNRTVAIAFGLYALAVAVLILAAPRRPRLAQVLFLILAGFLLTNKVNSPQYTVWLIPLAALARPRWGAFMTWQSLEILVMFTRYYFFVNSSAPPAGIPVSWFLAAILIRDVALLVLMGLVVREIWRPEEDAVRADGTDDPAGGVLDGAPDRRRGSREVVQDQPAALLPA